jgi:hypothetical protein
MQELRLEIRKLHGYLSVYPSCIRFSISSFQRGLIFMHHSVSSQHFFMRSSWDMLLEMLYNLDDAISS